MPFGWQNWPIFPPFAIFLARNSPSVNFSFLISRPGMRSPLPAQTYLQLRMCFWENKWITFFIKMDFFQKIYIFSILCNESFFRLPLPLHIYVIAKFNDPRRDNRANATRELRGLMYSLGIYFWEICFIFKKYPPIYLQKQTQKL